MKNNIIGQVEPIGGHGGMDYYDYGLSLGLGSNDIEVRYYTCDKTIPRNFKNVVTIICFRNMWNKSFTVKTFKYFFGHLYAFKDLRKHKSSIVHLHFFTFRIIDVFIIMMAKLMKLKVVGTVHDVNAFDKKNLPIFEKISYNMLDGVVVHNTSSYSILKSKGVVLKNIAIIPHGNYLPFIKKIVRKVELDATFKLLFFGQIKKVKGLDILLYALEMVTRKGYDIHLTIAGKAWKDDLDFYKNLIQTLGITSVVTTDFRYIPHTEVTSFYSSSDLVILPYREIYQSGVLLLTMSYGRPILCSNLEPFKEIICHNKSGFLFETENSEDLSEQIISIINNKQLLKTVVDNSDNVIRDKYDWVKIGKATKDFYEKISRQSCS